MDAAHEAHLSRILENRRRRGVNGPPQQAYEASGELSPRPATAPSHAQDDLQRRSRTPPGVRPSPSFTAPMVARHFGGFDFAATTPAQQLGGRMMPPLSPKESKPTAGAAAISPVVVDRIVSQQDRLQQQQVMQERKVDSLQSEIRRSMEEMQRNIIRAINGEAIVVDRNNNVSQQRKSQQMKSNAQRIIDSMRAGGGGGGAGASSTTTTPLRNSGSRGKLGRNSSGNFDAGTSFTVRQSLGEKSADAMYANVKPVPEPVAFNPDGSKRFGPQPVAVFSGMSGGVDWAATALSSRGPPPPPLSAQPGATPASADVASSLRFLSQGEWFLKWNAKGTEVKPRFVWLDRTKQVIAWAPTKTTNSNFCGNVKAEDLRSVTTSQVVEYDSQDQARNFFVLTIFTAYRSLKLATEVREKLDAWYVAINSVLMSLKYPMFLRPGDSTE